MAGPTASVIFQTPLSTTQIESIEERIANLSEEVQGADFWVKGRPFIWNQGEEFDGEFDELEYLKYTGWKPHDQILLIAMCNGREDHRILADLCLLISREFSGRIDFGGQLIGVDDAAPGSLWAIPYDTYLGETTTNDIGDVEFLQWWSTQSNFHMIK